MLTRKLLAAENEKHPGRAPVDAAVRFSHQSADALIQKAGYVLRPINVKHIDGKLESILQQANGIFLVEFYWRKTFSVGNTNDWHVIAVNCDRRLIFCNSLGVIPFANTSTKKESAETHALVAKYFCIRSINSLWVVGTTPM